MPEAQMKRRADDRPFKSLPSVIRPLLFYVAGISALLSAYAFFNLEKGESLAIFASTAGALLFSGAAFLYSRFSSRSRQAIPALVATAVLAAGATVAGFDVLLTSNLRIFKARKEDDERSIKRFANGTAWVKVFFATDRRQENSPLPNFGPDRSDGRTTYGQITVGIPRDHRQTRIERPSIWRLDFRENPLKHFVLVDGATSSEDDFYGGISRGLSASSQKQAFIFIHGFNVSFEDAIYRTAQIAYDLGFDGVPVLYSWPSNGELESYTWDSTANDWTVPHLKEFLESFATKSGARTVHIIAHSMGNRALINALGKMTKPKSPRFREVILTAPDIDADIFLQLADAMKAQTHHVTLYASSNDRALKLSKKLNGFRRAGDVDTGILTVDGIDSIDVSAVDTNFIGHFYYAENRSVLSDIFDLIVYGSHPPRYGLQAAGNPPGKYWIFAP